MSVNAGRGGGRIERWVLVGEPLGMSCHPLFGRLETPARTHDQGQLLGTVRMQILIHLPAVVSRRQKEQRLTGARLSAEHGKLALGSKDQCHAGDRPSRGSFAWIPAPSVIRQVAVCTSASEGQTKRTARPSR